MMLLRARDNNIQSFACIWSHKENQNEFLKHPKIKWFDGGLESPTSGFAGPLLYHLMYSNKFSNAGNCKYKRCMLYYNFTI